MIRFVEVGMGTGAVLRCARCHPKAEPISYRSADEIVAEARLACEGWRDGTGPNIRLSGPEPFGHPDLPRIVSGVVDAGCVRLGVDTDAIGLRSSTNAMGALIAGVRHVRFGLLAGTEGLHDALVGGPGSFDATRDGVRSYCDAARAEGLDVSITAFVPLCRHNLKDLPAAVGAAIESGAHRVEVLLADGGMDLESAVPWVTAACDTGVVNGVWVEVEGVPFCLLPGYDLHVADSLRARVGAKQAACGGCALDQLCGGAPEGASADQLAALAPPEWAESLAPKVRRARGEGDR